jgi:hypothetical protein
MLQMIGQARSGLTSLPLSQKNDDRQSYTKISTKRVILKPGWGMSKKGGRGNNDAAFKVQVSME